MAIVGSNKLFQIVAETSYLGKNCANIYWYRVPSVLGVDWAVLGANFIATVLDNITPRLSNQADQHTLTVSEMTSTSNFGTMSGAGVGDVLSADIAASFIALSVRLIRSDKSVRSGSKRYTGMVENNLTGNTFLPSYLTLWNATAYYLNVAIDLGVSGSAVPCIVRRTYVTVGETKILNPASAWIYSDIAEVVVRSQVTTQNSRK